MAITIVLVIMDVVTWNFWILVSNHFLPLPSTYATQHTVTMVPIMALALVFFYLLLFLVFFRFVLFVFVLFAFVLFVVSLCFAYFCAILVV